MTTIGIDTSIFIYHFQNHVKYSKLTKGYLASIENGEYKGATSVISLLEALVLPKKL